MCTELSTGMLLGGTILNIRTDLKSLHSLWVNLAMNPRYTNFVPSSDISLFSTRLDMEGLGFLTITLPSLGKALDSFHSTTVWKSPLGFDLDDELIPVFLGKAIRFALAGCSSAVDCVRQLSYVFYKLEVDYDEQTVGLFLQRFKTVDSDILDSIAGWSLQTEGLIEDMKTRIRRILCNTDPFDIRPCHGSGATACHTVNSDKWHKLRYYAQLDDVYPYADYFYYSTTHLVDELQKIENSVESVPRARVVLVPKDSRGPRVISCEPAELLYIQQGLMRLLYATLETHPLTSGQINFTDQTINRDLARIGSLSGEYATIDLSDASDRVSWELVRRIFPLDWVLCLEACRSPETTLPDGEVVKLQKFAPMGSSCCFPVEALVFWTCAMAVLSRADPRSRERVYVYGDDIIIPSKKFDEVVVGLESIGLLVNRDKSFADGPFRESCGGDYHFGNDVTPARLRSPICGQGISILKVADFCNNIVAKFGYDSSISLIQEIEEEIGYVFPRTELELPGSIRTNPRASNDVFFRRRWNFNLQRFEHRILRLTSTALAARAPDWCELLRKELSRDEDTSGDYLHWSAKTDKGLKPGYYTDIHSVRMKWTWTWLG